ncbi:MAG: ABC transporter permease [Chloroflexota bacterium]
MAGRVIRIEPRLETTRLASVSASVGGLVLALLIGAALLRAAGADPLAAYGAILREAFGTPSDWAAGRFYGLSDTIVRATPILLTGLGVLLGFKMRLWNIGAEGQLFMGAWAATGIALFVLSKDTPKPLMLTTMALAGMLAGGLWALIPGVLKAWLGVNEIITTLMLNYVAFQWISFFVVAGPWSERGFQLSPQFPESAWLPRLTDYAPQVPAFAGLTAHLGFVFGLVAAAALWLILYRSRWGYEIRVIGDNPQAARYAGMNLARNILLVMFISGALSGLAGMSEVAGVVHRLQDRFSPGYGFSGIIAAWLAKLNPWAILLTAILFGGLLVGAKQLQPAGIAFMLQGVILFVVIGAEMLTHYRLVIARHQTVPGGLGAPAKLEATPTDPPTRGEG